MTSVLPWIVLLALVTHAGAHIAIAVQLARRGDAKRAALAFVLPPLAPLWGWRDGMRVPVALWLGGLAVYALGVAVG